MASSPRYKNHPEVRATMGLVDGIKHRGPANYHHHYHNAIVGMSDAAGRYNATDPGQDT